MHFKRYWIWLAVCFSSVMSCDNSSSRQTTSENCINLLDDDRDGYVDCYDSDCAWHIACQTDDPEDCANGRDDDGDGDADCYDFDCRNDVACQGLQENCSNRFDDDADGLIDCADSDCATYSACLVTGEYCDNNVDDDGDGLVDCDDPKCEAYSECLPPLEDCDNNLDDDGDGFIDCDDVSCAADADCFNDTSDTCGNGTLDYGEECDTWNLNGQHCEDLGFSGGNLYCSAQCSFSVSGCFDCGNGLCEAGENQSNCLSDCSLQSLCGNGTIGANEECDGTNLNGKTCLTLTSGYHGGTLRCSSSCLFDTSGCYYCGNYICEAGENSSNCQVDCQFAINCGNGYCESGETVSNCPADCYGNGVCGNGVLESGEECDGSAFGGKTCLTYGYNQGTLSCYGTCQVNLSNCSNSGTTENCYNGIDDNANGFIDCNDGACWSLYECMLPYCNNGTCEIGETASSCPADCSTSGCPVARVTVTRLSSNIVVGGTTDICGNAHGGWVQSTSFTGTAIVFNVTENANKWVNWSGGSCSAGTLNWSIDTSKLQISSSVGTTRTCWAICTGNGPNFCCGLGTSFPAHCGTANTPKVWIGSWSN